MLLNPGQTSVILPDAFGCHGPAAGSGPSKSQQHGQLDPPFEGNCPPAVPAAQPVALTLRDGRQTNCGFTAHRDGFHTPKLFLKRRMVPQLRTGIIYCLFSSPMWKAQQPPGRTDTAILWVVRGDATSSD